MASRILGVIPARYASTRLPAKPLADIGGKSMIQRVYERTNITYWVTTALLAAQVAFAGVLYFTSADVATGFTHLGFPDYFRKELGIAKLAAVVLLILPMVPLRLKEWVYAGLAIVFFSAFVAHTSVDGISTAVAPVMSLALLALSYVYAHKREAMITMT